MALNKTILEDGFLRLVAQKPTSAGEAAQKMAAIYKSYARLAQANGVPPTLTGAEPAKMATVLLGGFLPPVGGSPVKAAGGLARGIAAFWLGVLFPPGTFTSFPSPVLSACLVANMRFGLTDAQAAHQLAACIDAATRLAIVTFPLPVGPVPLL